MDSPAPDAETLRALLQWHVDMGVDDVIGAEPSDFSTWGPARPVARTKPQVQVKPQPVSAGAKITGLDAPMPADEAIGLAKEAAAGASSIEELRRAITEFDGCPLKAGARNTVIDDGIFGAPILVLGEAPGRDEDRIGRPFVGRAGQLLDKMLAAIGHSRFEDDLAPAYISNSIFWRPPGNRTPTKIEIAICLPFVQKLLQLAAPKVIILVGNTPTQTLFEGTPGITRARGNWKTYIQPDGTEVPAMPMFHPAFLLRQPAQKSLAWQDLISVRQKLMS
jgi:DNA polymerase